MVQEEPNMIAGLKFLLVLVRVGLIAGIVTGCGMGSSYLTPSESTTTLMAGWEQHFTLEWTPEPEGGNARRITGYIYNRRGDGAVSVRVLAQASDGSGAVIGQRIEWVPEGVDGFGRTYFIVTHLPIADTYRVTIWDYNSKQKSGQ
jgi:hypothetical protein